MYITNFKKSIPKTIISCYITLFRIELLTTLLHCTKYLKVPTDEIFVTAYYSIALLFVLQPRRNVFHTKLQERFINSSHMPTAHPGQPAEYSNIYHSHSATRPTSLFGWGFKLYKRLVQSVRQYNFNIIL